MPTYFSLSLKNSLVYQKDAALKVAKEKLRTWNAAIKEAEKVIESLENDRDDINDLYLLMEETANAVVDSFEKEVRKVNEEKLELAEKYLETITSGVSNLRQKYLENIADKDCKFMQNRSTTLGNDKYGRPLDRSLLESVVDAELRSTVEKMFKMGDVARDDILNVAKAVVEKSKALYSECLLYSLAGIDKPGFTEIIDEISQTLEVKVNDDSYGLVAYPNKIATKLIRITPENGKFLKSFITDLSKQFGYARKHMDLAKDFHRRLKLLKKQGLYSTDLEIKEKVDKGVKLADDLSGDLLCSYKVQKSLPGKKNEYEVIDGMDEKGTASELLISLQDKLKKRLENPLLKKFLKEEVTSLVSGLPSFDKEDDIEDDIEFDIDMISEMGSMSHLHDSVEVDKINLDDIDIAKDDPVEEDFIIRSWSTPKEYLTRAIETAVDSENNGKPSVIYGIAHIKKPSSLLLELGASAVLESKIIAYSFSEEKPSPAKGSCKVVFTIDASKPKSPLIKISGIPKYDTFANRMIRGISVFGLGCLSDNHDPLQPGLIVDDSN